VYRREAEEAGLEINIEKTRCIEERLRRLV
jgi:hypothetical protein